MRVRVAAGRQVSPEGRGEARSGSGSGLIPGQTPRPETPEPRPRGLLCAQSAPNFISLNHVEPCVRLERAVWVVLSRSVTRARSRVCSFLVSGCEIGGFSQSGLICASLSLRQQIVVKYTHTLSELDTEFTSNRGPASQGHISGACLQRKQRNDT